MELTKEQIQELYTFTQQHFVEYYDVQTELVDHLANDIEVILEENPTLKFEQARDKSFKKFGICGFMDVVENRKKALYRKYWKMVWRFFLEFFNIPQVFGIILIWFGVYFFFNYTGSEDVYIIISFVGFMVLIFQLMRLRKLKQKRFKITKQKWLLEELIFNIGGGIGIFNLFVQLIIHIPKIETKALLIILSFVFTVFYLLIYLTAFYLPSKVENILKNQYPEYKFVTNQ